MALFQKQKQEKKRKGENVIGKIIYGFLLFAPLINILITCMYVTFNKNAYQSYSQQVSYKYKSNEVNNITTDLVRGNIYHCTLHTKPTTSSYPFTAMAVYNFNQMSSYNTESESTQYVYQIQFSATAIQVRSETYQALFGYSYTDPFTTFEFDFVYYNLTGSDNTFLTISKSSFNVLTTNDTNGFLDNAFIYGTQKTEESNLFNWSKTTGTYTVLNNVTNGIGITNTFIPMLMAYWLLISVVYFLFDIALILIWAVHDKIHELKDAI